MRPSGQLTAMQNGPTLRVAQASFQGAATLHCRFQGWRSASAILYQVHPGGAPSVRAHQQRKHLQSTAPNLRANGQQVRSRLSLIRTQQPRPLAKSWPTPHLAKASIPDVLQWARLRCPDRALGRVIDIRRNELPLNLPAHKPTMLETPAHRHLDELCRDGNRLVLPRAATLRPLKVDSVREHEAKSPSDRTAFLAPLNDECAVQFPHTQDLRPEQKSIPRYRQMAVVLEVGKRIDIDEHDPKWSLRTLRSALISR